MALPEEQIREGRVPDLDCSAVDLDAEAQDDSDDQSSSNVNRPLRGFEQRSQQKAIFESYLNNRARSITKEELKADLKKCAEEELSVESILASAESVTIKDPREYQVELFEKAKNENIIAVLDTGSGKTLIAVLLLRHILDKELEDRASGKDPKVSFFLVSGIPTCLSAPINCPGHRSLL
jgi:endoribonuclease Dicer